MKSFTPSLRSSLIGASMSMFLVFNANAQSSSYGIDLNGNSLNCATLQGQRDLVPGGLTCGFVEEVEQYIEGPKLSCKPGQRAYDPVTLQQAAYHMRASHGQPALYAFSETMIARINSTAEGKRFITVLAENHPREFREFLATYIAIENTVENLEKGMSIRDAVITAARALDDNNLTLPKTSGSTAQDIQDLFNNNPVMFAYAKCSQIFPVPLWSTADR